MSVADLEFECFECRYCFVVGESDVMRGCSAVFVVHETLSQPESVGVVVLAVINPARACLPESIIRNRVWHVVFTGQAFQDRICCIGGYATGL